MEKKKKREVGISLVLLLFSIANYFYADMTIKADTNAPFLGRADVYLKMWVVLLGVLSLVVLVRALLSKGEKEEEAVEAIFDKKSVFTIAMLVIYLLIMDKVGFIISTILFLFVLFLVLSRKPGEKPERRIRVQNIFIYLVISVALSAGLYCLFNGVLRVSLPTLL